MGGIFWPNCRGAQIPSPCFLVAYNLFDTLIIFSNSIYIAPVSIKWIKQVATEYNIIKGYGGSWFALCAICQTKYLLSAYLFSSHMHGAVIDSKANHRCCTAVVVKFQCRLAGNWNLNQHRLQATLISLFQRNRNGSTVVTFNF